MIEDMLAGTASPGLDEREVHLRLAITSIKVDEPGDAAHHLEHYLELAEDDSKEAGIGAGIMDLLSAGDLSEAEHRISELTEVSSEDDHGEEDDHHEDDHEDHDEEKQGTPKP